jgi:hypothetical protein
MATRNVGRIDRTLRALAVIPLATCAALAPLPLWLRLVAFVPPGLYFCYSALAGTCFGYALMGKSTCPVPKT